MVTPLMETGAVRRMGREQPRMRPDQVAADKGDSSTTIRHFLQLEALAPGLIKFALGDR